MKFGVTHDAERELIGRVKAGDRAAAAELVRAHQTRLYGYILRVSGNATLAEDVVQEAMVKALLHIHTFNDRYRFSTWLFTIARRELSSALDAIRRRPRVAESVESLGLAARPRFAPPDTERREDVDRFLQALQRLRHVEREVILMFHQLEMPIEAIALELKLPDGTVKSHLHRARARLRRILTGTWDEPARAGAVEPDQPRPGETMP